MTDAIRPPSADTEAMSPSTTPLPPPDLSRWVDWLRDADIPVLEETAEALEAMRANEDAVDANLIGEMIAGDPLMSLKVLAYASQHRSPRMVTDTETVTAAVVMMGISPFFRNFGPQPTVEALLADRPDALAGLRSVMQRAHRAAAFSLGFAVHRHDPDAAVMHLAALLHDFAEMLLWCHAPDLALRIREAQQRDPTLRSGEIQRQVLKVELPDLKQALMETWRLPELLLRVSDDRHADLASVKNVVLAIRLARHTAQGWDNAAIPDDVVEIAQLLAMTAPATLQLLHEIDD
jgi:HD-like signal output (HDOD) protein